MHQLDAEADGCSTGQGWEPEQISGCAGGAVLPAARCLWHSEHDRSASRAPLPCLVVCEMESSRASGKAAATRPPAHAAGDQGKQLELAAAAATWALRPRHTFVPWVRHPLQLALGSCG